MCFTYRRAAIIPSSCRTLLLLKFHQWFNKNIVEKLLITQDKHPLTCVTKSLPFLFSLTMVAATIESTLRNGAVLLLASYFLYRFAVYVRSLLILNWIMEVKSFSIIHRAYQKLQEAETSNAFKSGFKTQLVRDNITRVFIIGIHISTNYSII